MCGRNREISMKELCQRLSVSEATGRNWLRLGRLVPDKVLEGKSYFSEEYVQNLLEELKDGNTKSLKSRRNKKYVDGSGMYASYLKDSSENLSVISRLVGRLKGRPPKEKKLREILAECALQLFCQALGSKYEFSENYLFHYRQKNLDLGRYDILIHDLLGKEEMRQEADYYQPEPLFSGIIYSLEPGQDVLGTLYLSLKNIGARKAAGAYYTPAYIVQELLERISLEKMLTEKDSLKILDPCCGTGNFLLQLSEKCHMQALYGGDTDSLAVQLARINLAIACQEAPVSLIQERIQVRDFLGSQERESYDLILGNPPWGSSADFKQRQFIKDNFLTGTGREAYDLFLEQSFRSVRQGGVIAFVLPEAVLHVKSHEKIRKLMSERFQIQSISYLGNVFYNVQCPSVILNIQKNGEPLDTVGMHIYKEHQEFEIKSSRVVRTDCFNFHMPDEEYEILHKIEHHQPVVFLKGQADFALGIVTGNNKKYVQKEKTGENEIVLKGSDIGKYQIQEGKQYLSYEPENFQQTAPDSCYRAKEKLFYRFIGKKLIFAYDDRQRLSLNSCNIVIPRISRMELKYILAVFNSRPAQFVYDRKFCSVKVLRSYLEKLPVPVVSDEVQQEIVILAEKIMSATDSQSWKQHYNEADRKIASAYGLTEEEYHIICNLYSKF